MRLVQSPQLVRAALGEYETGAGDEVTCRRHREDIAGVDYPFSPESVARRIHSRKVSSALHGGAMEEAEMAIAMLIDNPEGSQEMYDKVLEHLALDGKPAGGILHVAGRSPGGSVSNGTRTQGRSA